MKKQFYLITCLTNMHVGSGDINFGVVDNEVEKDITGYPMIHSSGIKGALRDLAKESKLQDINRIFGKPGDSESSGAGTHKFLDAYMLCRTMRLGGNPSRASIPVVTVHSVNAFLSCLADFGCKPKDWPDEIKTPVFDDNLFLATTDGSVEGEKTGHVEDEKIGHVSKEQFTFLCGLIGDHFAIAKSFDGFDLPVTARNCLENGISKNLWYEENVPYGSAFYFAVLAPKDAPEYSVPKFVQFGGLATIGFGYAKVQPIGESNGEAR